MIAAQTNGDHNVCYVPVQAMDYVILVRVVQGGARVIWDGAGTIVLSVMIAGNQKAFAIHVAVVLLEKSVMHVIEDTTVTIVMFVLLVGVHGNIRRICFHKR